MDERKLLIVEAAGVEPEASQPDSARRISGQPEFRTWNIEDRDGLYAGVWEATPGKWRIAYDEWEFVHMLSGTSVVTEDGGEAHTLRAGDSFIIRPGFSGTWEVVETTRKEYVILMPART